MEQSVNQNGQKKLVTLEERLREAYGPVKPAPEFIESLQHHLITPPKVMLEYKRNGFIFLIMTFGLVFGVMLFMIIRAIYRLFNDKA